MKPNILPKISALIIILLILVTGVASASYLVYQGINNLNLPEIVDLPVNPSTGSEGESTSPGETIKASDPQTPINIDMDLAPLFVPFWESWEILHENYYDQPIDNQVLAQGAIDGINIALEEAGINIEEITVLEDSPPYTDLSQEANTPAEAEEAFAPFWQAWQAAEHAELGEDFTYEGLMEHALRSMVDSLGDPLTSYLDPDEFRELNTPLEGEYEGIGAWVDPSGEYLTIISPMDGSPAEAAGLRAGDEVIAVDGEDMTGIEGDIVIRHVLGPAGSQVTLTIRREGLDEPFDVSITRSRIVIPSVEGEILDNGIAYVNLFTFGENTGRDLHALLEDLMAQEPVGLILDLRNNGGGFLHTTIDVASEFMSEGVVLYEEYGDGSRDIYEVRPGGLATEIPIVVLINGGSASASEILAGMIQDYDRGILLGTVSYGKGSVQLPIVLANEWGALRVTIARWLTPNETHIQGVGLTPDIIVPDLTDEDIETENDPQLDRAIEILLEL
ncbi:MAG: S41 family peptidase [Chloroflexi bacterium]|nr:S41 family peptidase [Chloroflexota bacterium]